MELTQTKIPYLPPDWTVARVAKYVAKLGVFILVPGLHQIACRRRILGGLLLVLYFAVEFTHSYDFLDYTKEYFTTNSVAGNLKEISQYISWILLALDSKLLDKRKIRRGSFIILACAAAISFSPYYRPAELHIHVVSEDFACPEFCKNDIVEYDYYDREHKISVGDFIVVRTFITHPYIAKVLTDSQEQTCTQSIRAPVYIPSDQILFLPSDDMFCTKISGHFSNQYIVHGGTSPNIETPRGERFSSISNINVYGFRPRKIGYTREVFILSDAITDVVVSSLLVIYKWTGVDFLGLSRN